MALFVDYRAVWGIVVHKLSLSHRGAHLKGEAMLNEFYKVAGLGWLNGRNLELIFHSLG